MFGQTLAVAVSSNFYGETSVETDSERPDYSD